MPKENCLKIIASFISYLQEKQIVFIFPMINEKMLTLFDKSEFGTVEAEVSLDMLKDNFDGQLMLQNWMEVANHFGNMASACLNDFGHVALEMKEANNGMSVVIYFQPDNTDGKGGEAT